MTRRLAGSRLFAVHLTTPATTMTRQPRGSDGQNPKRRAEPNQAQARGPRTSVRGFGKWRARPHGRILC